MSNQATRLPKPHRSVGGSISPRRSEDLQTGFDRRFPGESAGVFIRKEYLLAALRQCPDASGLRFMYGLRSAGDPLSRVIVMVPCNSTSSHLSIPNSIILPGGYLTNTGQRAGLATTWNWLYQHAVRFSRLEEGAPFHRVIRGAFFGIDTLENMLADVSCTGIHYRMGYDPRENDAVQRHKPVLQPIDSSGNTQDDMDMGSLCPPFCGQSDGTDCLLTKTVEIGMHSGQHEQLNEFRAFRDQFLLNESGELVEMYYYVSPVLIEQLDRQPAAKEIYTDIFRHRVLPCQELIRNDRKAEAKDLFRETMNELMEKYLFQ